MITLSAGKALCTLVPAMGAAIGDLTVGGLPVTRPWSGNPADGPFALGCNLLAPFSNRIAHRFAFGGREHTLAPNLPGEPYPIHGDAFQAAWATGQVTTTSATLSHAGQFGPFHYQVEVIYELRVDGLDAALTITNTGPERLPFGGGFHPWFPRDEHTRLETTFGGHWPGQPDKLPATKAPQALPASLRFDAGASLPQTPLDGAFSEWSGTARISQGQGARSVTIRSPECTTAVVFAPSANADFFCFEPVSHPIDAHNLPGQPGLKVLAPGGALTLSMTLDWAAT
ncbi:MAG: aldose 1-epimerase [Devosiaceae bacterium]|nr:aldose 1-epimerase [Devosiaceae bacterium MH13]